MPHVRCAGCRARRTLTTDQALQPPRCSCGTRKWYPDRYRTRHERGRQVTCIPGRGGCNQYHYPHRRGSGWCMHNHNLTEERLRERDGEPAEVPCPF